MTTKEIMDVSKNALSALANLVNKPQENVISVRKEGNEWKVVAEVLERRAVPDTQDIIGRYEIRLDTKGDVLGYKQVMLKRRQDFPVEEEK